MVWWIPTEYWQIALNQSEEISQQQIDYLKSMLDDYTIFVVGDYSFDSQNSSVNFNVNDVQNRVLFYGLQGEKVNALKNTEIDKTVLRIINDVMKPLFGQMLGKMGNGVEFFIYNNKKNGIRIIDPTKLGSFKIEILQKGFFQWKLPLVALMADKYCPIDKEKMEGNWLYCPFHGEKL